tara:strand:- start:234 stop:671 length:438 start_codon:yes stop_codon:yes gene_type:complete
MLTWLDRRRVDVRTILADVLSMTPCSLLSHPQQNRESKRESERERVRERERELGTPLPPHFKFLQGPPAEFLLDEQSSRGLQVGGSQAGWWGRNVRVHAFRSALKELRAIRKKAPKRQLHLGNGGESLVGVKQTRGWVYFQVPHV